MENENKDINSIVEAAFEAEEKAVEETPVGTEEKVADEKPVEEAKAETPAEEKAPESEEKVEEKPAEEEKPADEHVTAPKQVRKDFADSHWKDLDADTKEEFTRLSSENERNYLRAAEAEHNAKQMRKTLEPVQGYISEVASQSNIPENEVIRNCVDIIQKLNDNPTLTARQMIAGGIIRFEDPVAVINEIAKTYQIDVKGDMTPRDIPANYYTANAQARYEARQAKYVKPEEDTVDTYVQDYVNNTPGIKALLDDPNVSEKFLRQIKMERAADPNASDIAVINKAAEMFEYAIAPKAIPVEEPKPTLAEKKMAKVVSPTASNPVEQAPVKKEPLTPEQSVRETLRAMGLDD
jgi:hypothetical protein